MKNCKKKLIFCSCGIAKEAVGRISCILIAVKAEKEAKKRQT